ncbi:hypothetical protein B9Z65_8085 [Elsinoe australis]|uniref:Uncharacterized protein n=1 Tax=Elsinoe australis TaxID=40998 RepID=A0A2P7YVZ9_9PEZI|nr:hypothetical protein B9Z65_8085 [Elsinoe australis]
MAEIAGLLLAIAQLSTSIRTAAIFCRKVQKGREAIRDASGPAKELKAHCEALHGLDECEDEESDLLEIIDMIKSTKNIKVVASSRDMQDYVDYFEDGPRLTVHEKTRDDIQNFVRSQINEHSRSKAVQKLCKRLSHDEQQKLVKIVTDKSEGVFLWVKFAIKEIRKGPNSDSIEELLLRLRKLPVDLKNMFEYMIGRIPQDYQQRAMLYFRLLAIEGPEQ